MNAIGPTKSDARTPARRFSDWGWFAFLLWTAVGFFVLPLGLTPEKARAWAAPHGFGDAAAAFLGVADAVWISLAAIVVYLHAVESEGLPVARAQAVIVLVSATIIEWVGTRTGYPFGRYVYTANFGPRVLGVVPVAIPLAWYVVVLASRQLMLAIWPSIDRYRLAGGVALLAVLTDFNLEFVAWRIRGYWIWLPATDAPITVANGPPPQNYLAWLAVAFALATALPADYSLRPSRPTAARPVLVITLMNALLAAARFAFLAR